MKFEYFSKLEVFRLEIEILQEQGIFTTYVIIRFLRGQITGFRAPFLQTGGDRQFLAMTSAECDLEYDSSRSTTTYAGTNPEKLWPVNLHVLLGTS